MSIWLLLTTHFAFAQTPFQPGTVPSSSPCATNFVIYAPSATRRLLFDDPVNQVARVNRWRDLLRERGAHYRILTNVDQWKSVSNFAHIILPSAYVLSDTERSIIDKRLADGCGLLVAGLPANRDGLAASADLEWVKSIFGRLNSPYLHQRNGEFVILVGDTPLTYGLPPGTRLWVGKAADEIRPGFQEANAAYVSDWSGVDHEGGALLFADIGRGRKVYMGWPESVWGDKPSEFHAIALKALDWVQGQPSAYLGNWPWPYSAAMTIGINVLGNFDNIASAVETLGRHKVVATFNVLTTELDKQVAVAQLVTGAGHELAVLGDRWQAFGGQGTSIQALRVESAAQSLRSAIGNPKAFEGMRTPEGSTDEATELAVVRSGGRYLVDTGRVDSLLPVSVQAEQLTLLPNSFSLDSATERTEGKLRELTSALSSQRTRVVNSHGYAYVGVDTNALVKDSVTGRLIEQFLTDLKTSKTVWMDSAAHIAQWWQERQRVSVLVERRADVLDLVVKVLRGATLNRPVSVFVVPPRGGARSVLSTTLDGARLEQGQEGLQILVLERLTEGEHTLSVRFE